MTREEAIQMCMEIKHYLTQGNPIWDKDKVGEALEMAIEALKGEQLDEWCTGCKEYDTEKKCCPRFNRVIRESMKRIPHDDGTLEVKVEDATKVGRVLISDDKHRGGLYYPDEYEPKGEDLISRAEAIDAIIEILDAIDHVPKWVFDKLTCAINILPSADRPRGEWISKEELIDAINDAQFVYDGNEDGHKEHDISKLVRVIVKDIIDNLPSADMRGDTE